MSVEINYLGRFGNRIFEYCAARLFADQNGLKFKTKSFVGDRFVTVKHSDAGQDVSGPLVNLSDNHDLFGMSWAPARYVLCGYFQTSRWYVERRAEIEKFIIPDPIPKVNTRDIVINLRIAPDYRNINWTIHPDWYVGILKSEKFDRLHIVTDAKQEDYLSHFKSFDPIVVAHGASGSPKGDWEYLRKFDRIVCANSTFSWWAAFLSHASRIWTFKRWVPSPNARYTPFPNGLEVDGLFLHEKRI